MVQKQYDGSSIQVLEGLQAVRKRPGMYIGSTDIRGLHHLIWEILDNAIDESLNGYGKSITITIEKDNTVEIIDTGRGVPVDKHKSGKSAVEVIYTILHAGGKFDADSGYKTAGGLHGVGASVVNALSEYLEVTSFKDGYEYRIRFEKGGSLVGKLEKIGTTNKSGTKVRFLADKSIFDTLNYSYSTIKSRVQESAFLLEGITFHLKDLRNDKQETFVYHDGIKSFLSFLCEDHTTIGKPMIFKGSSQTIDVDVALQYTDDYSENTYSYVNLVRTKDGGTHEVGLKTAITKCINDFARKTGLLKDKDKNFEGSDVREGLTMLVSLAIPENLLEFEGQTKSKLGSPLARSAVDSLVSEKMTYYLEENREFGMTLIKKIQKAANARDAARKAREQARQGKKGKKLDSELSGKLANAQTKNPKINELYLVEGDSAGGSAKGGRDSKFQAILPLRGKVLNVEKESLETVYKNVELNTIIHCIGAGAGLEFDVNDTNYDKVIIMTDADVDGSHIQLLLLTFFYRFMRPLIEAGKVYLAQPPLYKIHNKHESHYVYSDEKLQEYRETMKSYEITRYKGLGEMNASQLWETTMNPETRTLLKVTIDDAHQISKTISLLMGKDAEPRKEWIGENVDFDGIGND